MNGEPGAVLKAITAVKSRSRTTLDVARQVAVRLDPKFVTPDEKSQKEIAKDPAGYRAALTDAAKILKDVDWSAEEIEHALRNLAQRRNVPAGKIFQPIRLALTGRTPSEPVHQLLAGRRKEGGLRRPLGA